MSIDFSVKQVSNIIKKLDPIKAHGHNKISMHVLKLCGYSINKALPTIFKNCCNVRRFPDDWRKANVVSIHKKIISKLQQSNGLVPSFQFAVKYLSGLFTLQYVNM